MDDIISQGQGPGRGPWPRRLAIVALVLVVAAAMVINHLPAGHRARHSPRRHPPAAGPALTLPRPPAVRPGPDGITGPTASWAAGLRLPVGGSRPAWLWPATGVTEPIGGLAPGPDYVFTRAPGGWAVQRAPDCAGCAPTPVYFLTDHASSVTAVGVADRITPAAEPGRLWLTTFPPARPESAVGIAREVTVRGAPAGVPVRLPPGYLIDAATDRGLLLTPAVERSVPPDYELWDPVLGRVVRHFSRVLAASAGQVAWTAGCIARCQVRVLDLASGRTITVRLPAGSSAARGAFSQDDSLLALELSFGNGGDGGAVATQLEVAALPGGRLTVVPGTWASSDALTGFGWPSGGNRLVAELSFLTKVQVACWHPGARRLAVALVRPAQNPNALVVG